MDKTKNFKVQDDYIVFTGNYLEVYVPYSFEESKMYQNMGNHVEVFGVVNLRQFDASGKPGTLDTLNLPTKILLYPSEISKETLHLLETDDEAEEGYKYIVLKFYGGDMFTQKNIRQDSTNVELFLGLMTRGKIPNTVPYSKVLEIWHKNLSLNSVNLGVPSTILETIISLIYRYKKNPGETFGHAQGLNPKISDYDYKTANMREICSRSSTFSALTFEDMDAMITSSLNMNNYDKTEKISPIEKIIKM